MNYKPALELSSSNQDAELEHIDASVIWLHGLGADGYDFAPIVQQLNLPNIRFILPHAPEMAVTRNNGYIMPAWYDVYGLTPVSQEDGAGIKDSQTYIHTLIQKEIDRGVASERIALAGFSQGGAIALYTALRFPHKLAGVLALSTYLPLQATLAAEIQAANAQTPIFMAHGVQDNVISLETARASLAALEKQQCTVVWHEYAMAHSVIAEEISDIRQFLQQILH
jgi:phospholipase/carboxylesterase